jgi:putative Ca2+/H+ antiporter (TMEM165/GDT1 family)
MILTSAASVKTTFAMNVPQVPVGIATEHTMMDASTRATSATAHCVPGAKLQSKDKATHSVTTARIIVPAAIACV